MKLLIVSDIVTETIKTEITKNTYIDVECLYIDDLLLFFAGIDRNIQPSEFDCLFVHTDQFFTIKPVEWQKQLLESVISASGYLIDKKILLSNLFNFAFETPPYKQMTSLVYDSLNIYGDLFDKIKSLSNIFILDGYKVIFNLGKENCYNFALGQLYQMPYKKKFISAFAGEIMSLLKFVETEEKKVIILDCDNTLWKGIIGEDGYQNVKCDKNADGLIFLHFQEFLKAKKDEGFLLALCSKNNNNDVYEFFQKRQTPLLWDDFVVTKVNWSDKYENIQAIAQELNLGLSSFVFIDDNEYEIAAIANLLPEVTAILFENDFVAFERLINDFVFKRKKITESDKGKTKLYLEENQRREAEKKFKDFESFLEDLDIKTDMHLNDIADLSRLSQMTEKTNQFNFNKRAFTEQQLKRFIEDGNLIFSLRMSDKFGDYGIIGLILLEKINEQQVRLNNYLMSCRALGKKIEPIFFDSVMDFLKVNSMELVEILFRNTEKNIPAKNFLKNTNYDSIITTII